MTTPTLYQNIDRIVKLSRRDFKGVEALGLKLMEEVGEFAETINHHLGYLPHKRMKEPVIGEAADVIQNVIAILARIYPDKSGSDISLMLQQYLESKTNKWEYVLVEAKETKSAQDIKNDMVIEGHITDTVNEILSDISQIGGIDAIHARLSELVNTAVNKALGQEPQQKPDLVQSLTPLFNDIVVKS